MYRQVIRSSSLPQPHWEFKASLRCLCYLFSVNKTYKTQEGHNVTRFLTPFSEVLEAINNSWGKDNVLSMTLPASCTGSSRDTDFVFTHSRVDLFLLMQLPLSHIPPVNISNKHIVPLNLTSVELFPRSVVSALTG